MGTKAAATGEMELNGAVGPIGGIKQKTYGVRQAGATLPVGDNVRDARRYAGPLKIISVRSLDQVSPLATLPRGSQKPSISCSGTAWKSAQFRPRQRFVIPGSAPIIAPRVRPGVNYKAAPDEKRSLEHRGRSRFPAESAFNLSGRRSASLTFRVESVGRLAPPPQPKLVPRPVAVHAAA